MKKKITLILFSLLLCLSTYFLCYFIAEKFFFDKFFYYKSTKYGYWILNNQKLTFNDFGKRGQDISMLTSNHSKILGAQDNNIFKIAIFGDSLTWGQGLTDNQRFVTLLEKKLNKIRPTKIYSFANCGDNIFDDYAKYQLSQKVLGTADLYIFALYNNDLVFNNDNRYQTNDFIKEISSDCKGESIFDVSFSGDANIDFNKPRELSLGENSLNFCTYKKLLPLLPKEKAIYIDLGNAIEKWNVQTNFSKLINTDLPSVKINYQENCTNTTLCQISQSDSHPSALINTKYSEILFDQITNNSKYNFLYN